MVQATPSAGQNNHNLLAELLHDAERIRGVNDVHSAVQEVMTLIWERGNLSAVTVQSITIGSPVLRTIGVLTEDPTLHEHFEHYEQPADMIVRALGKQRSVISRQPPLPKLPGTRHLYAPMRNRAGEISGLLTASVHEQERALLMQLRLPCEYLSLQLSLVLENLGLHYAMAQGAQQSSMALSQTALLLQRALHTQQEETALYMAVLRALKEGVVISDKAGTIKMVNPAAEHILEVNATEAVGRPLTILPGTVSPRKQDPGQEQEEVEHEFELQGREVTCSGQLVTSLDGSPLGSVTVYRDVTREKMSDHLKTEFVAIASHELRTPLTSVGGYIDLLLLGTLGQLSEEQQKFLQVVRTNIRHLTGILNDILDVSRIEGGQVRLVRQPVDLIELIHEVTTLQHQQFVDRSISLALDLPDEVPPLIADRDRMRQIVMHLISNACKFTPPGGHVDVVVRHTSQFVQIDVRDTGYGISESDKPKIFMRFFRSEKLRDTVGGTGLGLSIARALVELHGGKIWFESEEDQGSIFSVALPIGTEDWVPASWLDDVA